MKYGFLFPGQGAQYPGMGKDLYDAHGDVRDVFARASDAAGYDVADLIFKGSEDDLKVTDRTQIAITVVNIAASLTLKKHGIRPAACAGFSLGEYAACLEAGILALDDVFPVVAARGSIMEEVSRSLDAPGGSPGMAAVIGLDFPAVVAALETANIDGVYPAIYNSPVQTVLSGTFDALSLAEQAVKAAGARRVIRLKVSGPFHCPLMEDARARFADAISGVVFHDPVLPVYSNVTGACVTTGAEMKELCLKQLVSTVRWTDEERAMVNDGCNRFLEVGPGTVLTGLFKAFASGLESEPVCSPVGTDDAAKAVTTKLDE